MCRGISDFKKGYNPRTNIVEEGKCYLVTDSHSILARRGSYFSQLLNAHGVNDVRQTEIHTAEPLESGLSAVEVDLALKRPESHKSPSVDQIPAELIRYDVEKFATRSINFYFSLEEGEIA